MKSSIEQGRNMVIVRLHPESIGEAELLKKMHEIMRSGEQMKQIYGIRPDGGFDFAVGNV